MSAPADGKAAACVVSIPSAAGICVYGVEPAAGNAASCSAGCWVEAAGAAGPVEGQDAWRV